jgi:hypothetical protein
MPRRTIVILPMQVKLFAVTGPVATVIIATEVRIIGVPQRTCVSSRLMTVKTAAPARNFALDVLRSSTSLASLVLG